MAAFGGSFPPSLRRGRQIKRIPAVQPRRRERVKVPHSCPCRQARRSVVQILPSEASARRSKRGRALSFFGSSGCGPSFYSPRSASTSRGLIKDAQRIDGRGAMPVVRLEIKTRQPLADGRIFDHVGCYEQLDGTAHFAVDVRILAPADQVARQPPPAVRCTEPRQPAGISDI